ncbi:Xanthine dehydrogenase, molybdenum binding subunit [Euzebya pacifica]|uniref:Xanthine dehydrogenase, molybdenum binding subunit n=1 Tax=Euzebya pacifica TaxID=1608957 RepID=A0A346Y1F6_9ACTN|nr:xanthine dehydrogenase subunit D [Euzebya pacifica]AXV08303.1 Xanthine dehydrogenase, molybdenum binding subunit [Euzebya pacifica]
MIVTGLSDTATPTTPLTGALGDSADRPDGMPKVTGDFAFSSDLHAEGMLWGRTLRSPHAAARIRSIDTSRATAMAGVHAVLLAEDVPGSPTYGMEHRDQPVFASDVVRYHGEPVAAVAADHPELAVRALAAIEVDYEPLIPLADADAAITAPPIHPDGNVFRHIPLRHGDPDGVDTSDLVTVEGTYEVGMQDQAFLGPESGMAIPDGDGGVDLWISTQWLHVDRDQVADCLGLPRGKVRLALAGVGGAFGGREDVSLQIHACLLALATGRPVKMLYSREESFYGHVHRHPARLWYRHHATRDGDLVKVEARVLLDGGAYASSSTAVIANATCFAAGPYRIPHAAIDGWAVRTNNPPCGAMRGFGAVQTCFAHEAQMDRLAEALDMDPVALRLRNALATGDTLLTGQVITGTAPVKEVIEAAMAHPLPPVHSGDDPPQLLPGGTGMTSTADHVRRGVGMAVGFKNLMFSEGFDDHSTAAVTLELDANGHPVATAQCAAAEVGQGFHTLALQILRSELGVQQVMLGPTDTSIGSAGSTSASRQTWMSGGAVQLACHAVRDELFARASARWDIPTAGARRRMLALRDGEVVEVDGARRIPLADLLADGPIRMIREHHHPPTEPLDANGQGNAHVSFAFAAHRAVVDVDPDLGLLRVVQVTTGQDVGRVLNPRAVVGQIEGGIAQGVGLAIMEEVLVHDGLVRNPSFTDYLIPTMLDMPEVLATVIEQPEPGAPFGAKGVGEPPTISSTPAVVAAIRDATGAALIRVPVRPQDIALPSMASGSASAPADGAEAR